MTETNNQSSIINHQSEASGHDLDVWGGEPPDPVPLPAPGRGVCVVRPASGCCPSGCRACLDFLFEMDQPLATPSGAGTEDDDGIL